MSIDNSKASENPPNNVEPIETCITLPMKDEMAIDILKKGNECQYLRPMGDVRIVLEHISKLNRYSFSEEKEVEEV